MCAKNALMCIVFIMLNDQLGHYPIEKAPQWLRRRKTIVFRYSLARLELGVTRRRFGGHRKNCGQDKHDCSENQAVTAIYLSCIVGTDRTVQLSCRLQGTETGFRKHKGPTITMPSMLSSSTNPDAVDLTAKVSEKICVSIHIDFDFGSKYEYRCAYLEGRTSIKPDTSKRN